MSDVDVAENEGPRDESPSEADVQQTQESSIERDPAEQLDAAPVPLVDLPEELTRANERALRAQAELENFRKRVRREMDEERRYARVPLISELLPVMDNLDRALEAAEHSEGDSALLEGVKMVRTQLLGVLEQSHCRAIDAVGTPFDPHLQEAIGQEPSDEHDLGVVTRVVRIGYQLHDRVVRPSQVLVSSGPAQTHEPNADPDES